MLITEPKQFAHKPPLTGAELFHFSIELFLHNRIYPAFISALENATPAASRLFVLFGNNFIYPQNNVNLKSQEIHRLIKNNKSGIYRKEINLKTKQIISVSCVASNIIGNDLIIGLVYTEGWNTNAESEIGFYEIIGQMQKFFEEFSKSKFVV